MRSITPGTASSKGTNSMRFTGRLLTLLAGAILAAPAARAAGLADELDANRDRWRAAATGQYRYGYQKYCDCHPEDPPETIVSVEDGRVVRVYHLHSDSEREVPAREGSLDLYWTIEGLFDLVAAALEREVTVRVQFDDALGYPERIYIDYDPAAVGDELDVRLTRVELSR